MLTQLHIAGDAFELGHQLGTFGYQAVNTKLRPLPLWQRLASLANSDKAQEMQTLVRARFPRYWREIEGLAAGLELPVDEVFMWNCRGDFAGLGNVDGCTTVYSQTAQGTLIAHNEDGLPQLRSDCAIVHAKPNEGTAFVSFLYPGSIPGHTFAVNEFGVVATVNNLRPTDIPAGLPRQILGRAALEATSIDEAVMAVSTLPRAGAFHHAFAQAGSTRIVSIEATSTGTAVVDVLQARGHANHRVNDLVDQAQQIITASSASRQQRVNQLMENVSGCLDAAQALAILRDDNDTHLPIYRCAPDDPDDENTLATAIFTLTATMVEWRVYTRRDTQAPEVEGVIFVAK